MSNTDQSMQPWLFYIEPMERESLSHFLGRVRRKNHLTPNSLGQLAEIGAVVARWERFHLNPYPREKEFLSLAEVVGLEATRLWEMLPPKGVEMKCEPIRLCGACYSETPCHCIEWQFQTTRGCARHRLLLLSKCPRCEAKFQIPALWGYGDCRRCRLPFGEMGKHQKVFH